MERLVESGVYPVCGLDPRFVNKDSCAVEIANAVEALALENKCVAIGVTGLEYSDYERIDTDDDVEAVRRRSFFVKTRTEENRAHLLYMKENQKVLRELQRTIFREQVKVALKLRLPFVARLKGGDSYRHAIDILLEVRG